MKGTTIATYKMAKHASKIINLAYNKHANSLNMSPTTVKYSRYNPRNKIPLR